MGETSQANPGNDLSKHGITDVVGWTPVGLFLYNIKLNNNMMYMNPLSKFLVK